MMTRLLKLLAAAVVAAGVLPPGPADAADKVRMAYASVGLMYIPLYLAEKKGFFTEEGIELSSSVLAGSAEAITALISDDVQVVVGLPIVAAQAVIKGQPLKNFAGLVTEVVSNVVVSGEVAKKNGLDKNSSIEKRLNALKGLTIAAHRPNSSPDLLIRYIARVQGWNPERDLTIAPILGPGPMLAAFINKRVDGFILSSPTSDEAVIKHGGYMLLNMGRGEYTPLKGLLYLTLIGSDKWLNANPEVAANVVRAAQRGINYMKANEAAAKETVRGGYFATMDPAVFTNGWDSIMGAFPTELRMSAEALDRGFKIFMPEDKVDANTLFTNRFVELAAKRPLK